MLYHTGYTRLPAVLSLAAGLALTFTASAAVYTEVESATESDYKNFQVSTIVVDVHAIDPATRQSFGERIAKAFKKRGVTVYLQSELFPAPEEWNAETQERLYESLSIDALMLVDIGGKDAKASFLVDTGHYSTSSLPGVAPVPPARMSERDRINVDDSTVDNLNVERKVTTEFQALLVDTDGDHQIWVIRP